MARINLTENTRPDRYIHSVLNMDTTATQNPDKSISVGTPLILNLTATAQPTAPGDGFSAGYQDGLQVVLPSTAGPSAGLHFLYGIALGNIQNSQYGETMVHGVCLARIVVATRAASTNAWVATTVGGSSSGTSYQAPMLSIDTVNNGLGTYTTLASANLQAPSVLLDSITMAGSASTATDTRTAITTLARVFVRMM